MNKRCANCGRFPFCDYQDKCTKNGALYRVEVNLIGDYRYLSSYWIKRENKEVRKCQN